jgi:hypothetical protein
MATTKRFDVKDLSLAGEGVRRIASASTASSRSPATASPRACT